MCKKTEKPGIKPSDAKSWSLCPRRVWLDNKGDFEIPPIEDEFEQLIIQLGREHERRVLENLTTTLQVQTANSIEHTAQLMSEDTQVIYQAQLLDQENGFTGFPDFLIRHESGDYQPADAKLSLSEEKRILKSSLDFTAACSTLIYLRLFFWVTAVKLPLATKRTQSLINLLPKCVNCCQVRVNQ